MTFLENHIIGEIKAKTLPTSHGHFPLFAALTNVTNLIDNMHHSERNNTYCQ